MYEVMEYTIMSDVYDEYIDMHPAIEAFGKKESFGQKIIDFIKKILAKIRYIITGKKSKKEVLMDGLKDFAQPIKYMLIVVTQIGVCSAILTGIFKVFSVIVKKIPGLNNNPATIQAGKDLTQANADLDAWIRNYKDLIDEFEAMSDSEKIVARQQFRSDDSINKLKTTARGFQNLLDYAQNIDTLSRADDNYIDPRIVKLAREIIPKAIEALNLINKYFLLMEA